MTAANLSDLSVASYAHGVTWWNYITPHSRREIEGTTYWREFFRNGRVMPGDWLFILHRVNGVAIGNSIYVMQESGQARRLLSTFNEE